MIVCKALFFLGVWGVAEGANILALFPLDLATHHLFLSPIVRELALRGHQVTVVTPIEDKKPPPKNFKQILVPRQSFWDEADKQHSMQDGRFIINNLDFYDSQILLWNTTLKMNEIVLKSREFQEFLKTDKTQYDLIIYEIMCQEVFLMLTQKYKNIPIIGLSTIGNSHAINNQMGNSLELAYASSEFKRMPEKLGFLDRMKNTYATFGMLIQRSRLLIDWHDELAKKYFTSLPEPLPSVGDIEKNVTMVLSNSHMSINVVRPNVPGIVEVAGVHIKPPQKLPQDLQKYMDSATNGVILFSMGSQLKSSELPDNYTTAFVNVFKKLNMKVIWKWDTEHLPGKPDNVFIAPWLPQSDILAHPNLKLFITHCGTFSYQEAVSRGVPIVGIPVYGDQPANCEMAKNLGMGEILPFNEINEETIQSTLNLVLKNARYQMKAKKLSTLFNDRPMTPIDTAMYWIEYVIRHKGAVHLDSPAKGLSWYEYYMVDVTVVSVVTVYYTYVILSWMFFNVALRKKIERGHLKELIEKQKKA